jgi:hypothetical protein
MYVRVDVRAGSDGVYRSAVANPGNTVVWTLENFGVWTPLELDT